MIEDIEDGLDLKTDEMELNEINVKNIVDEVCR